MKNVTKAIALILVLSMVCVIFASCGKKLSGTYRNDSTKDVPFVGKTGTVETYKFSGHEYTYTVETYIAGACDTVTETGTYEIIETDSGSLQILLTKEGADDTQSYVFEESDGSIKIRNTTYKVVE